MGGSPYASAPVKWAGAVEDETMFKKKQLLPKDLAARAQKVDPAKVEAEVLRIISAKPAVPGPSPWVRPMPDFGQILQVAGLQQAQAQQLQQYVGNMWGGLGQNQWGSLTGGLFE